VSPSIVHSTQVSRQETWSAGKDGLMTLTKAELAGLLFEWLN
jgi:hypothetical protein